jgi:hypothetical protein
MRWRLVGDVGLNALCELRRRRFTPAAADLQPSHHMSLRNNQMPPITSTTI